MNLYDRIMGWIVGVGTRIGALALAAVMFIIVANVVYRAFGGVIPGTYDLVETVAVLIAAFALPETEYRRAHTNVDMVTIHIPRKPRLWLENVCYLVSFGYWVVISWATARVTMEKAVVGEATELLKISTIPFRSLWDLGLILTCVVVVYNVYRNLRDLRRDEP
jgi:TRAP-type C4-dicarboxylate transport system permease small subunit